MNEQPRIIDQIENWRSEAEAQATARRAVESAARAVIAAGRPHKPEYLTHMHKYEPPCVCPQCAAWDALKQLLETP